jgi:hypothetical protein
VTAPVPQTPDPQREIVVDMTRRALMVAPFIVAAAAIGWGRNGAFSALFALVLVMINFALSATVVRRAGTLSNNFIMMFVLGGFAGRMLFVLGAITLAGHFSWVSRVPLGATVIVTHLGLLIWETRHLSLSLAYPALKPRKGDAA